MVPPPSPSLASAKISYQGAKQIEKNTFLMVSIISLTTKKCGQKAGNIYENGALGGRSSDGGDQNPGGGVILPEAQGGGMGQYIRSGPEGAQGVSRFMRFVFDGNLP